MNCDITVPQLKRLDSDISFNFTALISECGHEVCKLPLGSENADLSGRGAVVSYFMQLSIALLFGPVLYFFQQLQRSDVRFFRSLRILRSGRSGNLHDLALYTQLYFGFVLGLGCLLRQYNRALTQPAAYESIYILDLSGVGSLCVLMTWASSPGMPSKPPLFIALFVGMIAMSAASASSKNIAKLPFQRLLTACFGDGAAYAPFNPIASFSQVAIPSMILIVSKMVDLQLFSAATFLNRPRITRIILALSLIATTANCIWLYAECEQVRNKTRKFIEVDKENDWGIGQISAPFAWAPLFVEMVSSMDWRGLRVYVRSKKSTVVSEKDLEINADSPV